MRTACDSNRFRHAFRDAGIWPVDKGIVLDSFLFPEPGPPQLSRDVDTLTDESVFGTPFIRPSKENRKTLVRGVLIAPVALLVAKAITERRPSTKGIR